VQRLGERVMARHHVLLAAFLVQPDQPTRALRLEIFHAHLQRRPDASKAVSEGSNQGAISQIPHCVGRDGVDQPAPLLALQHRCLAALDHVLRTAHRRGRVGRRHLADDQPVEQHPHRGELLLHAGRRVGLLERLHIGGDIVRPRPSHQAKNRAHARA
jgi:hypothetical protein